MNSLRYFSQRNGCVLVSLSDQNNDSNFHFCLIATAIKKFHHAICIFCPVLSFLKFFQYRIARCFLWQGMKLSLGETVYRSW